MEIKTLQLQASTKEKGTMSHFSIAAESPLFVSLVHAAAIMLLSFTSTSSNSYCSPTASMAALGSSGLGDCLPSPTRNGELVHSTGTDYLLSDMHYSALVAAHQLVLEYVKFKNVNNYPFLAGEHADTMRVVYAALMSYYNWIADCLSRDSLKLLIDQHHLQELDLDAVGAMWVENWPAREQFARWPNKGVE